MNIFKLIQVNNHLVFINEIKKYIFSKKLQVYSIFQKKNSIFL